MVRVKVGNVSRRLHFVLRHTAIYCGNSNIRRVRSLYRRCSRYHLVRSYFLCHCSENSDAGARCRKHEERDAMYICKLQLLLHRRASLLPIFRCCFTLLPINEYGGIRWHAMQNIPIPAVSARSKQKRSMSNMLSGTTVDCLGVGRSTPWEGRAVHRRYEA